MADLTAQLSDMAAITAPAAPEPVAETPEDAAVKLNKKIEDEMKTRVDDSVTHKKTFLNDWKRNVDVRLGQPVPLFTEGLDIDANLQSAVNPDWSLTKTKTANLFSQVPPIRGTHYNKAYAPAVMPFLKQLNYELGPKRANVGVAMNECLNDVVNASGVAAAIVQYSARFDNVQIAAEDPLLPAPPPVQPPMDGMPPMGASGAPPAPQPSPMVDASRPISDMFSVTRISPRDLLWPAEFMGSDFNCGDWIGHRVRTTKAVAQAEFDLTEEEVEEAVSAMQDDPVTNLRSTQNKQPKMEVDQIAYNELFYWRYRQDPNEKNFKAIWRIVYVDGIDKPVKHEPWKGQRYDPQTRKYVGACRYPVQVLTLTYITDNPIPPSDSAAGRPQVSDMRRSRSQMFQNRQRSIPIRWFDVNRIDQDLQANLMRGIVQGMIPTNGAGDRAIGEIARASYPSENLEFDQAAKHDLMESWQVGPDQMGSQSNSRTTAAQSDNIQQNFTTRIGQERAFVSTFLLNLSDVMAGLLCLYSTFPVLEPEELQAMQQSWDRAHILHDLVLDIVPDSTIMVDAAGRTKQLMGVMNMTVQSGFVNPEPIIAEILELNGLDPAKIMTKPPDKKDSPNISYRFSGKDDLMNPLVVALMMNEGVFPDEKMIEAAKKVLDTLPQPAMPPQPSPGGPGPGGPPPEPMPNGQRPPAHPDWQMAPKVASRSREMGGA